MGLIAARKSLRLIENVHCIVSVLVAACYQAATMTGVHRFSPAVRGLLELLATKAPGYRDDQGVAADFLDIVRTTTLDSEADALLPALDRSADPAAVRC